MLKRSRFYVAIALLVQSVTLCVLFIFFMFKKKSVAAALLAIAALEGATGAYLLSQIKEEEDEFDPAEYLYDGDDFTFDFDEEDIAAELARDDDDAPIEEPYTIKREDDVSEDEFKND